MSTQRSQKPQRTFVAKQLLGRLALMVIASCGVAAAQPIRASVNSIRVAFPDVQPMMMNDRVMVPVRGVFEHMNATVTWDEDAQAVHATRGDDVIHLPIGSRSATVNGREVMLDTPAVMHRGRTVVPLRFLSESLGAEVVWVSMTRTVEITTAATSTSPQTPSEPSIVLMAGTVLPFRCNDRLSSNNSRVGDRFTANLDTSGASSYQGLVGGAVLEGHVDVARAKVGTTPGILGLAFDRVRLPDGRTYMIRGALIGLDSSSVENKDGRLVAKPERVNDNLKYVGYGGGVGALVAIVTGGNLLTDALIGGALGLLLGEIQKDPTKARDVTIEPGSPFGLRLTQDLSIPGALVLRR